MSHRSRNSFTYFTSYLLSRPRFQLKSDAAPVGCSIVAVLSALSFALLLEPIGPIRALLATVFLAIPVSGYLAHRYAKWMSTPKTPEAERQVALRETLAQLQAIAGRKRLPKELEPAVGALFEESARHWSRIQVAFQAPYWNAKDLPSHWIGIRNRSMEASNAAMQEMILILRPVMLAAPNSSQKWEGVFETILEAVFEKNTIPASTNLPPGFEPARHVAERLKQLAGEVERISKDRAKERATDTEFSSAVALESCLTELKSLRQAEEELDQHLKQDA